MNYKIAFKLENGKTQFSPWLMKDDPQGAIDHAKSYVNVHHAMIMGRSYLRFPANPNRAGKSEGEWRRNQMVIAGQSKAYGCPCPPAAPYI
jgi:hypothetical protein